MASSAAAAADADAPIVVRVTGGTRQIDRSSAPSASASSSVDRMLDASLPPAFVGGDTFRAVLDWHLRAAPGDRNLVWRVGPGNRVLGADVPIDGRLADWVRVLGGSPLAISISPASDYEAIKYAFACHLAGLPWPLWDADERDPINRRLLGVGPDAAAAAAPRLDEDNRVGNLVGLRHGRHVKFVNVHALADAMKRGNTVEPVFRTNVADRMDDFVRCIQAVVHASIHPRADDPAVGLLPIIELATMVVDQRYGRAFAANSRRAAGLAMAAHAPAGATRAPTLSPAAQQWEEEQKERKKTTAAASPPPPRQPNEEEEDAKKHRADVLAEFTSRVQAYLRTTPDVTLSRVLNRYADNPLVWNPLSVDDREKLVRAEFNLFLTEKERNKASAAAAAAAAVPQPPAVDAADAKAAAIAEMTARMQVFMRENPAVPLVRAYGHARAPASARLVDEIDIERVVLAAYNRYQPGAPYAERKVAAMAKLRAWVRTFLQRDPDASLAQAQGDALDAKNGHIRGIIELVGDAELEQLVRDEFTRHTEERKVAAMLRAGDEQQLAGAVSAAAAAAAGAGAHLSDQIQQQKSAAAAALSASSKKKKKKKAVADYPAIGWYDTKRIQNVVDAMTKEAQRVVRGDDGKHMKTVKKAAVAMLDGAGLRTTEAKRELRLRLDQIQADAAWNAAMDNMQASDRRENGQPPAAAAAAAAAASSSAPAPAAAGISADERRGIEYDIRSFDELLAEKPKTTLVEAEQANLFYRRALSVDGKKEQMRQALASYRRHVQSPAAAGNPRRSIVVLFRAAQKKAPDAEDGSAYWSRESELMIELGRSPPVEQRAYKRMLAAVQEIELRVRRGDVEPHKGRAAIANAVLVDYSDKAAEAAGNGAIAAVDRMLVDDHDAIIRRIADEVTGDISVAAKLVSPVHMDAVEKSAVAMLKKEGVHTPDAIRTLKARLRKIHHRLKQDGGVLDAPPIPASSAAVAMDADDDALSARLVEAKMRKKLDKIRAGGQEVTVFDINGPVRALLSRDGVTDKAVADDLVARLTKEYTGWVVAAPPSALARAGAAASVVLAVPSSAAAAAAAAATSAANHLASRMQQLHW